MSDLKITALGFESLVFSTEEPIPTPLPTELGIPINPMVFRPNWSSEIKLRTRWMTDVTRPDRSNRTERWSLLSRPSRTLSVTLTGMSKDESEAMLQAARQHTKQHGVPVPLYPDAVAASGSSGTTIYGDFSRRRFFRGGRVVVYPAGPSTSKSSGEVFFATVTAVYPDRLDVDSLPRAVTGSDSVAPCIDVEITNEIRGSSLTDSIWEASMSWAEVEGACSLPAVWPSATGGDPSILAPFCSILDNLAVFPFDPNWEDGVGVDISREMESTPSGRGLVKTASAEPTHRFSISLMGYSRERIWNIARFFDAMRGRAGSFYLIHPTRPWRPYSPMVQAGSLTQVRIQPAGDRFAVQDSIRKVVLTRADGSMVTRDVSSVIDNGDRFDVVVTPALPDENFVDAQPIFVCGFDSDEIEESWATSEVIPAISLVVVENPSPGDVTAVNQEFFQFQISDHAFQSVPGLNLLLRAGSGCYSSSGALCSAWPGNSSIARWVDESGGPPRDSRQKGVVKQMTPFYVSPEPSLIRFPSTFDNNKQTSIASPGFNLGFQTDPSTPVLQRPLWSSSGWTLFLCTSPFVNPTPNDDRPIVHIGDAGGLHFRLLIDTAPVRAIPTRTLLQVKNAAGAEIDVPIIVDYRLLASPVLLCIRIGPSSVQVWVNGTPATSTTSLAGIWTSSSDYTTSTWFTGVSGPVSPSSSSIRSLWAAQGCANLVASYNRALSEGETDYINRTISDLFRCGSQAIVLY